MDPTDHICSCSHGFYKWKKQKEQNKIHISHKCVHSFTVFAVFNAEMFKKKNTLFNGKISAYIKIY